jgi:opacity protein-like surface antigen
MKKTSLLLVSMAAALLLTSLAAPLVTNNSARAAFPGINGKIVFVSNRSGNNEISTDWFNGNNLTRLTHNSRLDTMHANGTHQKKVPNASGSNAAFSPSGRKIIYDAGDIYTLNVDGTNRTRITNYKPTDPYERNPNFANPVWSPVSNKIAFTWSTQIHVMPLSDLMGEKYSGMDLLPAR